ncbi:hypothetical protein CLOP_g22521 [Closterium sp. NIES-67]|nr:hypothetical protein CLOP_g22521 [Closterium sp. NIES-67]
MESRDVIFHEGLNYKGWKERGASHSGTSNQDPHTASIFEGAWEDPGDEGEEQQEEPEPADSNHEDWQQLLNQQLSKTPRTPMKRVTWEEKLQRLEEGEATPLRRNEERISLFLYVDDLLLLCSSFDVHAYEDEPLLRDELVKLYQSIVGSLMYACTTTQPQIAFAVSQLSKVASCPKMFHLQAAKRVLRSGGISFGRWWLRER